MARFRYLAFDADGRREEGSLDVADADQAWDRLVGLGLTVVEITPADHHRLPLTWDRLCTRHVSAADQADLADQLSVLFGAHLPVTEVLRVAVTSAQVPALKRILLRLRQLVEDGQSLTEAFAAAGSELSPLFASVARMGEAGNRHPQMFLNLAAALRRQDKLSIQIGSALVYPFILVVGGMVVFLMMTMFLAPRLSTIFLSARRPMPAELAFFTGLGDVLEAWGPLLAILLAILALATVAAARLRRHLVLQGAARLPIVGPVLRDASLARLSAATGLLLQAGIPLVPALREVSRAFGKELFAELFDEAADAFEGGGRASEVFRADQRLSPMFRELFAVGEQTNRLPDVLAAATQRLEAQTERRIQRLLALLTPTLTLIIGGAIAFLVYSVMGALMSVNDLAF